MGGIQRLGWALALLFCCTGLAASGCQKPTSPEGTIAAGKSSEAGEARSNRLTRSEVACRLHSCAPPFYCNQDKGVCERLPCTESRDCPYGYNCDFRLQVCQ
jgi:hypothetical protein